MEVSDSGVQPSIELLQYEQLTVSESHKVQFPRVAYSKLVKSHGNLCHIYDDTINLLNNESNLQSASDSYLHDQSLKNAIECKLSLIILGDSYKAQCECLNWLLGVTVVPVKCPAWIQKGRTLKVKHATKPRPSFPKDYVLPVNDSRIDNVRLTENSTEFKEKCHCVEHNTVSGCVFMDASIKEMNNEPLEVLVDSSLLRGNLQVFLQGDKRDNCALPLDFNLELQSILPIFIFALSCENVSSKDLTRLKKLQQTYDTCSVLFWVANNDLVSSKNVPFCHNMQTPNKSSKCLDSVRVMPFTPLRNTLNDKDGNSNRSNTMSTHSASECAQASHNAASDLQLVLEEAGFFFDTASNTPILIERYNMEGCYNHCFEQPWYKTSVLCRSDGENPVVPRTVVEFINRVVQFYLLKATRNLNRYHKTALDALIMQGYSLLRDVMITPKRLQYAYQHEKELYCKLVDIATHKQAEIVDIIATVKREHAGAIIEIAENFKTEETENPVVSVQSIAAISNDIQNMVLEGIKSVAADRLADTVNVLRESMTGTLSRCIECLELTDDSEIAVDDGPSTHLKKILNAAYNVKVTLQSSSSLLKTVMSKVRRMLRGLAWKEVPVVNRAWKRSVAENVLNNLCEDHVAKSICSQFRSQLHLSHASFLSALRLLEDRHYTRIGRENEKRQHASKILAPKMAQLALRSRSLIDELIFGMPKIEREIGRGMYGVVYTCSSWPNPMIKGKPCAVKSVVPHDEHHWNNLALEFFYSMCLPPHPRIVRLFGSVVDESYGNGLHQPQVLLVMERMYRDLHCALRQGMYIKDRMKVALHVVEGIRYLHSQGLVHRDIKPKNVLLDHKNRAKIADLGFCKPSAMMSGSIVGTPIHMPPELFTGQYDSSVDVYAFGILFWQLCGGSVGLPKNYRLYTSKDHLWDSVKKGIRPEHLPCFSEDCWKLMQECWHEDAASRPLPGIIQTRLEDIMMQPHSGLVS